VSFRRDTIGARLGGLYQLGDAAVDLIQEIRMIYKVALHHSEEGYSITVPGLPGCCSQGSTETEALANIADAIREYLEVAAELAEEAEAREVEVAV
jgi:predicted RNase H-like HicB family nuclease